MRTSLGSALDANHQLPPLTTFSVFGEEPYKNGSCNKKRNHGDPIKNTCRNHFRLLQEHVQPRMHKRPTQLTQQRKSRLPYLSTARLLRQEEALCSRRIKTWLRNLAVSCSWIQKYHNREPWCNATKPFSPLREVSEWGCFFFPPFSFRRRTPWKINRSSFFSTCRPSGKESKSKPWGCAPRPPIGNKALLF
ncbi:MAG: hypothetical protein HW380_1902 [Magnetococcales bacterium]|nr:hypothetical protein [Magnetococcales bacterium]